MRRLKRFGNSSARLLPTQNTVRDFLRLPLKNHLQSCYGLHLTDWLVHIKALSRPGYANLSRPSSDTPRVPVDYLQILQQQKPGLIDVEV